jgi:hypothetical protein
VATADISYSGADGGWSEPRVLQVQYRNIKSNDLANFRNAETQAVVWPRSLAQTRSSIPTQGRIKAAEVPLAREVGLTDVSHSESVTR